MTKQQIAEVAAPTAADLRSQLNRLEADKGDLESRLLTAQNVALDIRATYERGARKFALKQGPLPDRAALAAADCVVEGLRLLVQDQETAITALTEELAAAEKQEQIAAEADRLEGLLLQARREFRDLEAAQDRLRKAFRRLETTSWSDVNKQSAIDERRAAEAARDEVRRLLEQTLIRLRVPWLTEASERSAKEEADRLGWRSRELVAS